MVLGPLWQPIVKYLISFQKLNATPQLKIKLNSNILSKKLIN